MSSLTDEGPAKDTDPLISAGRLYVRLHTAPPDGQQFEREVAYPGYARQKFQYPLPGLSALRRGDSWNTGPVMFPPATGNQVGEVTHVAIGNGVRVTGVARISRPVFVYSGDTPIVGSVQLTHDGEEWVITALGM